MDVPDSYGNAHSISLYNGQRTLNYNLTTKAREFRLASLPMYRLGRAVRGADIFWHGLARHLRDAGLAGVPDALSDSADLDRLWRDPALLLAQTCGYPLVTTLAGDVRLVATPVYRAAGCSGPFYRSALIVRRSDSRGELAAFRDATAAINSRDSHSGHNLFRAAVAPLAAGRRFFARVVVTGSHCASLRAVLDGCADIAAIDCVSLALAAADDLLISGLRVLEWTRSSPGLPLITALATDDDQLARIRAALTAAECDPALKPARDAMLLDRFEFLPASAYDAILALDAEAAAGGDDVLR